MRLRGAHPASPESGCQWQPLRQQGALPARAVWASTARGDQTIKLIQKILLPQDECPQAALIRVYDTLTQAWDWDLSCKYSSHAQVTR
jgi:hypothetical protein